MKCLLIEFVDILLKRILNVGLVTVIMSFKSFLIRILTEFNITKESTFASFMLNCKPSLNKMYVKCMQL